MTNLDEFPVEILLEIFSYLSPETISTAGLVSKKIQIAAHVNLFWKKKIEQHFSHIASTLKPQNDTNWYAEFRKAYNNEYKELPVYIKKLFSLVKEEDVEGLKILKLSDLDKCDKNDISLLEWIKKKGNQSLLDYIYQIVIREYLAGITVNTTKKDSAKRTILHWAILCHQPVSTIDLLILQGADIDILANGHNALRLAAAEGQAEIVELLITKYHADINAPSVCGATALLFAIEHGHKDVFDVLLKHNADITIPLQISSTYHSNFKVEEGDTPLHAAIKLGRKDIVKDLLKKGADINIVLASGHNALRLAAAEGQAEIAELLITKYHADINAPSVCGATALILAIEHGHKNVVDVLLKHKADITIPLQTSSAYHSNFKVEAGDTPLHAAIKSGRKDIVKDLLKKGADINVLANGHNALRLATAEGQAEIAELLITKYHADINAPSRCGATALILAIEHGHKNVVDVLLKHKADITIPLQRSNAYHSNFKVEAGDTPLHVASRLGNVAVVQMLIYKNADIEAVNNQQQTPVDVAVKNTQCRSELKLLYYLATINRKPDTYYKRSCTLFGHKFTGWECSLKENKIAAKALAKVVFFNSDNPSKLFKYREKLKDKDIAKALNKGELGSIYRSLCIKYRM